MDKVTIKSVVAKSGAAIVEGVGVIWDTGQADVATAGTNAFGIALESLTGDGVKKVQVALLNGAGEVKVKCSGTATQGSYAICGTDGFENQTLGGGTTVRYVAGKFAQTGVDGDFVGLTVGQFAGVSS
jgi:hypothetical protein